MVFTWISLLAFLLCSLPTIYWLMLAVASIHHPHSPPRLANEPYNKFAIVLPAHDEENVIGSSVGKLLTLEYPLDYFDIHVVADYCKDLTVQYARQAGAVVHERNEGPRTGKGAALAWLLPRVFEHTHYDAIIIFDADTQVEQDFLQIMNTRLNNGAKVIQGKHVISNPQDGWFPALTWAMFIIDNRYQNLGRNNLGWSAKIMGDSICFRTEVLQELGWGEGLTEDFQLRQRLLLNGQQIIYDPNAIGKGEAPRTFAQARAQRMRWLRGTHDSSRQYARQLLWEWLRRGEGRLLDGVLQAYLPSYSTLTMFCIAALCLQLLSNRFIKPVFAWDLVWAWVILSVILFIYPFFGLFLERSSYKAYLVILSGPFFILWRTWLAFKARFIEKSVTWIRTAHGTQE